MKVYTFIFLVGFLNLTVPFLGIPFVYKNYTLLSIAVITLGYALIVRAITKEKENNLVQAEIKHDQYVSSQKTIEDVVDMVEEPSRVIVSDGVIKRRGRKPKVIISEQIYE